jgi:four helix bundle protein
MPSPSLQPVSVRRLDCYQLALELIRLLGPLRQRLVRQDRDLASQLRRASAAVPLNLAEAMRRTGADRAHLLTVALGSASEVGAIVDVAEALGVVQPSEVRAAQLGLDRLSAMLYRLRQRCA